MIVLILLFVFLILSLPTINEIYEDISQFKDGEIDDHKPDVFERALGIFVCGIMVAPLRTWGDNIILNAIYGMILSTGIFVFFFDYVLNYFRIPRKKWSYLGIGPNSAWTDRVLYNTNPYLLLFLKSLVLISSLIIYILC